MKNKIRKQMNKSGKCQCQVCKEKHILEEHHIDGRDIDNYNSSWNKCYICSNCHTKIHFGYIIIEKWLYTGNGLELIWHEKGSEPITEFESKPYIVSQSHR